MGRREMTNVLKCFSMVAYATSSLGSMAEAHRVLESIAWHPVCPLFSLFVATCVPWARRGARLVLSSIHTQSSTKFKRDFVVVDPRRTSSQVLTCKFLQHDSGTHRNRSCGGCLWRREDPSRRQSGHHDRGKWSTRKKRRRRSFRGDVTAACC